VAKAGAPIYEVLLWILRETPRPQAAYAWTQLVDVLADHNLPWDPEIMRQRALEVVQRDARRLLSSARSAVAAATFAAIEPCAARSRAPVHRFGPCLGWLARLRVLANASFALNRFACRARGRENN